jgi:hypothetical protein
MFTLAPLIGEPEPTETIRPTTSAGATPPPPPPQPPVDIISAQTPMSPAARSAFRIKFLLSK